MKPTDQEITAAEKIVCYSSQAVGGGHTMSCRATEGGTSVSQETEGEGESMGKSLYCDFHGKEWATQDKQVYDWLFSIISVGSGAWTWSLAVWYLVLG